MNRFRSILFWAHLVAGLVSGISVGIMCFTGTALAYEKQLIAWAERDVRRVSPPADGAPRLTIEQLQAKLREAQPEARPMNIVLQNDPRAAVAFTSGGRGGGGAFYVNPYTGEVRAAQPTAMTGFMQTMTGRADLLRDSQNSSTVFAISRSASSPSPDSISGCRATGPCAV